jgi:hypothetical protein
MSATDVTPPPPASKPSARLAGTAGPGRVSAWLRVAAVSAILLGSYGVRTWQARRIDERLARERLHPEVTLAEIPLMLGSWKGEPRALDPTIARATGADQVVTRRYVNQDTGVALEVILLYGPAVNMYIHAPELCYPTAGYAQVAGPDVRVIGSGPAAVSFRSLVYSKGEGGGADLQEVFYSWWYDGRWTPELRKHKDFERIPGMYKIQVARPITAAENRDASNPIASFLGDLLPEMQRRMAPALR